MAKLKQAADATQVFALLRSGSSPGLMYVEGEENGVRQWVESVHVCTESLISIIHLTIRNRTSATRIIN